LFTSISALVELAKSATDIEDVAPPENSLIGSRVRMRRIERKISPQELSRQLEIRGEDLAAYEAGTQRISANLLFRIAKSLDVRPEFFFRTSTAEAAKAA
jgi:transcriptional regulator with XRE-family HTH domain